MESKDLLYETLNQAAWITLNRPRLLNALSAEMLTSIKRSYEAAGDDRDVSSGRDNRCRAWLLRRRRHPRDGQREPGEFPGFPASLYPVGAA
jgi:hypothetical protein